MIENVEGCDILREDIAKGRVNAIFEYTVDPPEGFWNWFTSEADCFEVQHNSIPGKIVVPQNTNQQCFHNSQLIALGNQDVEYYEGLRYGPIYKGTIHHGFNLYQDAILDVTLLANGVPAEERDRTFVYFGIKIPKEFIASFDGIDEHRNLHIRRLYEFYKKLHL